MNVSTMDTVRTMAITHMSYETKRYTEADYDTAVEYSVMNIMDEEYLFSLHLGEFEVLVEIDTSLTKTSHFYILQEYGNRHEHDVEKVIALRSNGPSVPLCLLEKANCNLMSIILTLMKLHSMKYWLVGAMRVIELGKCSLLIHSAFHTF